MSNYLELTTGELFSAVQPCEGTLVMIDEGTEDPDCAGYDILKALNRQLAALHDEIEFRDLAKANGREAAQKICTVR